MAFCPGCGRPVAMVRDRCLYCGAPLPPELVEQARATAEAVEAADVAEVTEQPVDRVLVILDLTAADPQLVADALALPIYEASQRARRGLQLHRIAPALQAEQEVRQLAAAGLKVLAIPEAETRAAAEPLLATGGQRSDAGLELRGPEGPFALPAGDVLLVVKGPIARERQAETVETGRPRVRSAVPEPGYRFHVHRRSAWRPVELDPASFSFGAAHAAAASLFELSSWVDALQAPVDDGFKRLPPALSPAAPDEHDPVHALRQAEGLTRKQEAPVLLDNLGQFRFYSAWRAAVARRVK